MLTAEALAEATSLVGRHVPVTPCYRWPLLEEATGTHTWVKHEDATPTGAFKVRGGLVFAEHLAAASSPPAGLIAATRGNHGQSVAFAAQRHGLPATIVVPEGNSTAKNNSMRAFGAELVIHGHDFQESLEHATALARERDLVFVPSFHPDLVAGVATGAAELHAQAGPLDVVYVPVGLGSGICAHMAVRDLLGLDTEIVGVVADGAPTHALSYEAGRPVPTESADTFVDGVATRTPVPDAIAAMVAGVSRFVRTSEADALEAMRLMWHTTRHMPEPAGALSLAGLLADQHRRPGLRCAVILSGGNCDDDLVRTVASSDQAR